MGELPGETVRLGAESIEHLRAQRTPLLHEWGRQVTDSDLLLFLTRDELAARLARMYDTYLEALETGTRSALEAAMHKLLEGARPHVETYEMVGIMLLLHDVVVSALLVPASGDPQALSDAAGRPVSRLTRDIIADLVRQRERSIREEGDAIRNLSTPLLPVRDRLVILPLIGVLDPARSRQLTEQVLRGIRSNRAKVVIIDVTGVPALDASAASHLMQTIDAARLLGTKTIMSGLSPELAHQVIGLGVDLGHVRTVVDLQAALEEAEALLPLPRAATVRSPARAE